MGRRFLIAIAASAALWALPATGAEAASSVQVSPSFGELNIDASDNVAHDINVSLANGVFTITDTAGITAADGTCAASGPNTVLCADTGVAEVFARLGTQADRFASSAPVSTSGGGGEGNDVFSGGPARDSFDGDEGDDQLFGNAGRDSFSGDSGNDLLIGGPEGDSLDGGAGNDALSGEGGGDFLDGGPGTDGLNGGSEDDDLDGGTGPDFIVGGAGRDELRYPDRVSPVRASLAAGSGNGEAGENDTLAAADVEDLQGGQADDVLTGNGEINVIRGEDGNDTLNGEAGDDELEGGLGNNAFNGGPGDDFFDAERGADTFTGGPGEDGLSYSQRRTPVTVTINNRAGDGEAGENDNVRTDVEDVNGGSAADKLTGGAGPNEFDGNAGNDRLTGLGGDDNLFGGTGNDVLSGGNGADELEAGFGRDILSGGRQRDTMSGGPDGDTINSRSGEADQVRCFGGRDRVNADRRDAVEADCELVRRR